MTGSVKETISKVVDDRWAQLCDMECAFYSPRPITASISTPKMERTVQQLAIGARTDGGSDLLVCQSKLLLERPHPNARTEALCTASTGCVVSTYREQGRPKASSTWRQKDGRKSDSDRDRG